MPAVKEKYSNNHIVDSAQFGNLLFTLIVFL